MKTRSSRLHHANITIVALLTVAVLGISLASYLFLTSQTDRMTFWSQYWNLEIPIAEAGLEEALTQIYYHAPTNLSANGWALEGGLYSKTRYLDSNSYFVVKISADANPVIISEGYVRAPLKTSFLNPRRIQVNTIRDGLFSKGMVAKGQIDLSGNNVRADSFDSADPNYSTTTGGYDPAKFKDGGDIATNSGLTNSLAIGNANVFGHVSTGPGGSMSLGPLGGAGSKAWMSNPANAGRIQPGWSADDMNVDFPDVTLPFTTGSSPGGGNPLVISSSGNYGISGLTKSLIITNNAQVTLVCTGDIRLSGINDQIQISPGCSLTLYMAGDMCSIGGNGVVNQSGNATNFAYYGTTNNTDLSFSGNSVFVGTVYAPQADFSLSGGGTPHSPQDFIGASVTGKVKMNGHFNFHYDENLGRNGPRRGYVITNWFEL